MRSKLPTAKQQIQRAQQSRQDAVATNHRDLSSDEINFRITHANTLISMYESQRARNQRVINDATNDVRTCERMIAELTRDAKTLSTLIHMRRS